MANLDAGILQMALIGYEAERLNRKCDSSDLQSVGNTLKPCAGVPASMQLGRDAVIPA
jgi:hypothetical protein